VDAFQAAKEAGYTGTLGGIAKMFRENDEKKAGRKEPAKRGWPKRKAPASGRKRRRHFYDEATKAAIVSAALEARKAGKKWPDAL